jgi:hypothetical protein
MKPIKCRLLQIGVATKLELQKKLKVINYNSMQSNQLHLPEIPERKEIEDWQDHT